jgi:SAM-dependent methyltransferase
MSFDRERLGSGSLPIWVLHEHEARWRFASELVADKVVVDCACGVGEGALLFARAGAVHVHAFDLSDEAVEAARRRCAALASVTVARASALSLPLSDGSADLFVSFETIEHIDDERGFLAEVTRVLAEDGTLLCSTPNRSITMPGKALGDKPWNPFHVREFNQSDFETRLRERFDTVRILGQNAIPMWRVHLLEMLGRRLPGHLGGRINSALKLPRLAYDRIEHHLVREIPDRCACEYLVAICTNPK